MPTLPAEDQPPRRPPTPIPDGELLLYVVIGAIGVIMIAGYAVSLIGGREHLILLVVGSVMTGVWMLAVSGEPVHKAMDGPKR